MSLTNTLSTFKHKLPLISKLTSAQLVVGSFAALTLTTASAYVIKNHLIEVAKSAPENPYIQVFSDTVLAKTPSTSEFKAVVDGQKIEVGTVIKTSETGRAQLVFPNGTVTRIDFSSEITLSQYDEFPFNTKIAITRGRIWSAINKLLGNERFQTQSDSVIASVRGTSYGHDILDSGNKLKVAKGVVEGICLNEKQKATLHAGTEVILNCGEDAPEVSTYEPEDEWANFNSARDDTLKNKSQDKTYQESFGALETSAASPKTKDDAEQKPTVEGANTEELEDTQKEKQPDTPEAEEEPDCPPNSNNPKCASPAP